MRVLLAYYSRTGHTKDLALAIKSHLNLECEVLEIHENHDRKGFLGYLKSGFQVIFGGSSELNIVEHNPSEYELLVIGTPNWIQHPAVPVNTYMHDFCSRVNKVAFFCSYGGSGVEKVFRKMEGLVGEPVATLAVTEEEVEKRNYEHQLGDFIKELNSVLNPPKSEQEEKEED